MFCKTCNSFKGVGPLMAPGEKTGERSFKLDQILWEELEQTAQTCDCCEVLLRGITGCLDQHSIGTSQVVNLKFNFVYCDCEDDEKAAEKEIICSLSNGEQFEIQFFTLDDEGRSLYFQDWSTGTANSSLDTPCPDAWEDVPVDQRISASTNSEEAFGKLIVWLDECVSNHEACPPHEPRKLPTRVIDVGRRDGIIKLVGGEDKVDRYLCLSHCWGPQQIIITKKATLEQHKREIPPGQLSRTFTDAITITRSLGFDYIWIDSLCIVQDDPLDWERESANMASIYAGGHLTLAATRSSSGHGGLFTETPDFEVFGINAHDEEYLLYFRRKIVHELAVGAKNFPLFDRGWVYQERILSPRIVHFGHYELFWECMSDHKCECDGIGFHDAWGEIPLAAPKVMYEDALSPDLPDECRPYYLARTWRTAVMHYTELQLTKMSDRLPALSGIARHTAGWMKSRYLAGLWEKSLLDDLLWITYNPEKPRHQEWRAPSWSWASIDTSVNYNDGFDYWDNELWRWEKPNCTYFTKVESCECTPQGFGALKSGTLRLSGPAASGILQHDPLGALPYHVRLSKDFSPPVRPDYALDQGGYWQVASGTQVVCLKMSREIDRKRDILLVLRPSPQIKGTFERIAMLHVYDERHEAGSVEKLYGQAPIQTFEIV